MADTDDWLLEIRDETGPAHRVPLDRSPLILGRSASADIQVDLPTVSRQHAELFKTDTGWSIRDLGSRGGTLVNGLRVESQRLTPDDRVAISRLRIRLIDPSAPEPSDLPGGSEHDEQTYLSEDVQQPDISVLTHVAAPKLDTSHIAALSDFGKELMKLDNHQDRLDKLCAIVAGGLMNGRWALALKLDAEQTNQPPKLLAAYPKDVLKRGDLHISRSTIRAMQESGAPVLASNFAGSDSGSNGGSGGGVVEMSIISNAPATAAVACPLNDDEPGSHTLLYVNLPPMLGSTEWLALIALAVKQYQQAEAVWTARQAIAARAAIDRDIENARKIQQSILPRITTHHSVEAAWSYLPCDSVGGDLLDVIAMPDGRVLLVIADVTGHGLQAALTTLSVHSILQTTIRSGLSLVQSITRMNDHLTEYMPDGKFVTLAAVALDPATGKTQCICAGHHPPAVYASDGTCRDLNGSQDMILGIMPQQPTASDDQLAPGDTLLLTTDGLTELPRDDGEMLGIAGVNQLVATIHRGQNLPPAELAHRVETRLRSIQADRPMLDDQTFLLARWQG